MSKRWFGPKTIGYGIGPKGLGGWGFMLLHLAATVACIRWVVPLIAEQTGVAQPLLTGLALLISLAILIAVVARTYRKDPN